ncbi:ATP-binding protein [Proteiniclasticum sp. C24MP]|uniref:ATP-binding protein n=1 Tax=Proteiniclasticum sp. C24MP TaxID=3374101 RepID=UPI003753EEB9
MKQLLILSGKGGTGKTTVASAFIKLSEAQAYADCDVDAPNLHLITEQSVLPEIKDYYGLPKAEIHQDLCVGCGLCSRSCRFDAISYDKTYEVNPFVCEGCGVCALVCPAEAITLKPAVDGEMKLYQNQNAIFSTAQLKMGSGTSGMLVSEVKKQMKSAAGKAELAVIDGSPGIGCPVIASISGVDMVLIVAEPSISGISDLERIVKTAVSFGTKTAVCINKYDTNAVNSERIQRFCRENNLSFAGVIPYDLEAVRAINSGKSIAEVLCPSGNAVQEVYAETMKILFE